jgi:hypothetical protein
METQAKPSNSQSSSAAPFAIRTPSAVVTDLGTEFGVEVDSNGRTTSHVFRGSVSVQPIGSSVQQGVVLHAGEAAFVETSSGRPSNIARVDGIPSRFVRRVPNGRISIPVFGTGIGSGAGQRDPHWRVVACSNDPAFEAQNAVVVGFPRQGWPVRDLQREQWISTHAVWNSPLPPGGTYTFRTDFELAPEAAKTARLTGFFYADKCIRAFRLNGRNVPVAQRDIKYEWEQGSGPSGEFSMDQGFVEGQNVLEIEVESGEATETAPQMAAIGMKSALGLRVVLRGWALTP